MRKTLRITVNGKIFDVLAEVIDDGGTAPAAPAPVAASARASADPTPVASAKSPAPGGGGAEGEVCSPLAGKVVSIDKGVGTAVQAGETVMTLEAMKMNTTVSAPAAGKVQKVLVTSGDSVEEGQVLMIIA